MSTEPATRIGVTVEVPVYGYVNGLWDRTGTHRATITKRLLMADGALIDLAECSTCDRTHELTVTPGHLDY